MKPIIYLCYLIFIFQSSNLFSQDSNKVYLLNPDYHVAKELNNRRIVMLGDFGHHEPNSLHSLVAVLREWIEQNKEDRGKPSRLVLILETDEEDGNRINTYIRNGNLDTILNYRGAEGELYLEDIEFCTELRKCYMTIDSLNRMRENKINLDVKGFEEVSFNLKESYEKKSQREQELWFVNERDSFTAAGIINYMQTNPDTKALIFYGEAHLSNEYANKKLYGFSICDNESYGYWLAHFLKTEFGVSDVLTIAQDYNPAEYMHDYRFSEAGHKDILLNRRDIPWEFLQPENYDMFIIRNDRYLDVHMLDECFSKFVIKNSIETMIASESWRNGNNKGSMIYGHAKYRIQHLTGHNFVTAEEAKQWTGLSDYDGFKVLDSYEFSKGMYDWSYASIKSELRPDTGYWAKNIWPKKLKNMKFFSSVGVLWVGEPDEKIKAKQFLKEFTGENFTEPEKYLQWYRKKYEGYAY